MKKIYLICTLFMCVSSYSQREFWGLSPTNDGYSTTFGSIFKTDINCQNTQIVHLFDEVHGKQPIARLFLASNGKLYGTATKGGSFFSAANNGGVLFEYDLIFDRYRVVANFGGDGLTREPFTDVIEPIPGVLMGASLYRIFRYDIATETTNISVTMPEYNNGNYNLRNNVNDQFVKASDGFIYGVTVGAAGCIGSTTQAAGTIIKVNPQNNTFSQPYIFSCYPNLSGNYPIGSLVEGAPGKLYGTTELGGAHDDGVLFEFDITSNTYTKIFDFEEAVSGKSPRNMINGGNGKLYGITLQGGTDPCNAEQHLGTLFEYDVASQTVATVINMGCDGNFSAVVQPHSTLLKASNGYIYGIGRFGSRSIFKFDPVTNTAINANSLNTPVTGLILDRSEGLIEVCRKPSYHYFDVDTFSPCVNTPFTFDVQNTNATSYSWKKNGEIVPQQTTGVLDLPNITANDAGDYTCEMVNECGTTVTMALHINVGCLGIDEMAAYKEKITLYPNPAKDILNIKMPENSNFKVTGCTISNMLGQIIYESNAKKPQISTANYATGMYNVTIKTDKGNWSGKFVKE
jgi:uncharacterized repeat protein (TIGR03803 family)